MTERKQLNVKQWEALTEYVNRIETEKDEKIFLNKGEQMGSTSLVQEGQTRSFKHNYQAKPEPDER